MVDDLDALHRSRNDVAARDRAQHHLRSAALELAGEQAFLVVEHYDGMTVGEQAANKCRAGESGSAGD